MENLSGHGGRPVYINVYDLIDKNDFLFGRILVIYFILDVGLGVLHSGVVIDGREYSFGDGGGVVSTRPQNVEGVKFRERVFIGYTFLSPSQICDVISNLKVIYKGDTYHILNRNCNTFSNDLCKIVTGKEIPPYVNRCAKVGSWFSGVVNHVTDFVATLDIHGPNFDTKECDNHETDRIVCFSILFNI